MSPYKPTSGLTGAGVRRASQPTNTLPPPTRESESGLTTVGLHRMAEAPPKKNGGK